MKNNPKFIIFILAIGYMIDFFDLTIFAVVRTPALQALGVPQEDFISVSSLMFNAQAVGVVVGGILSGIWGDKFGRMSAVRAGILLYSVCIILNAFVTTVPMFALMRFLAAVGLAGEFAASITLLSELLPADKRAKASGIIYSSGVVGGMLAAFIGSYFNWQVLFIVGGLAGLILLFVRISVADSIIYQNMKYQSDIVRGSIKLLIFNKKSFARVVALLLAVVPFWFMAFFVNFAPEIAKSVGIKTAISQGFSLGVYFVGSFIGSYFFPFIAKLTYSRKKSIFSALLIMFLSICLFSLGSLVSIEVYYSILFLIGLASGYSGLLMVFAVESFGTNQRNIASSIISNLARCSIIIMNAFVPWMSLQFNEKWIGLVISAGIFLILGTIALLTLKETNYASLDYNEGESVPS